MQNKTEEIASKYLGQKVSGKEKYDSSYLVAIPRDENRKQYKIDNNNLPFKGFDIWQAYEFSALTDSGLPVTRLMKLKYDCDSEYLIESKSLKLYLNSFFNTFFITYSVTFAITTPIRAPTTTSVTKCTPRYSRERPISAAKT